MNKKQRRVFAEQIIMLSLQRNTEAEINLLRDEGISDADIKKILLEASELHQKLLDSMILKAEACQIKPFWMAINIAPDEDDIDFMLDYDSELEAFNALRKKEFRLTRQELDEYLAANGRGSFGNGIVERE